MSKNSMDYEQESKLVDYLVRGKVLPFIGSGLSCNVDLPSWNSVVRSMEKEIGRIEEEDFFDTAQRFEEELGRRELIELLKRELSLENVNTDKLDVHFAILDFPFLDIFTTNQDLVLEAVLANLHIPHVPIRSHKDLQAAKSLEFPRVVKFHGDLIQTEEIVFTRKDVESRMEALHPFDIYLQGRLIENAILFIGYGLNDPNVKSVWKRVKKFSSPDCSPTGFRLLLEKDEAEIDRMSELGILSVIVPVTDLKNPVELMEWLCDICSRAHTSFHGASMEYLFHGRLAPSRTLNRFQLTVLGNKLMEGTPLDDLLKEAIYFQRIPQLLRKEVEQLLQQKIGEVADFDWMWEVAFNEKMDDLATAVLDEMYRRQTTSRTDMSEECRHADTIIHHFDGRAMKVLLKHLERLKSVGDSDEKRYHHVVFMFDVLLRCLARIQLDEEDDQNLKVIQHFYERKYPVIRARWDFPASRLNARERIVDGMRRSHVYVANKTDKP